MSIPSQLSETAIWERVIHPERGDLHPETAKFFLKLAFEPSDLELLHDLAQRNQADALTADETETLHNYRQVGLHSICFAQKPAKRCNSKMVLNSNLRVDRWRLHLLNLFGSGHKASASIAICLNNSHAFRSR